MGNRKPYPPEVRERAVRMVVEHGHEYETRWAAIKSIAQKFGMTAETMRLWVRQTEVNAGRVNIFERWRSQVALVAWMLTFHPSSLQPPWPA